MKSKQHIFLQLLGASLFVKALSHILGGLIGICGMEKVDISTFMGNAANNTNGIYTGILLQIMSCIAIIVLGALLYQLTNHISKPAATIALSLYIFESFLLAVSQVAAFSLLKNSQIYIINDDTSLTYIGSMLLSSMDFVMNMANIPFGLGAILFFLLLYKSKSASSCLSLLGLITVIPVFAGTLIQVYSIAAPFGIMVLHAPFEFIAGMYLFISNSSKTKQSITFNKGRKL